MGATPGGPADTVARMIDGSCLKPTSKYSALQQLTGHPSLSGDWAWMEDIAGKPGWIGTNVGSVAMFPLNLTPGNPAKYPINLTHGIPTVVAVSWLRSYENLGTAAFEVTYTVTATGKQFTLFSCDLQGLWRT